MKNSTDFPRLTQMVKCAGCAAKIPPALLVESLKDIKWPKASYANEVLVGFSGCDDAGVYQINPHLALVQTTDFFPPVVDDPQIYGKIAAANALSDVYAMGGTPLSALNIVGYPADLGPQILKEILQGGALILEEANCALLGGHSVNISEMLYGLAVTGTIHPKDIKTNAGAKAGDVLILTKALGTGVLNTMVKRGELSTPIYQSLINSMCTLNAVAGNAMIQYETHACTDITGFSLMGHGMEMAKGSQMVLKIHAEKLPILPGAEQAVTQGFVTGADKTNREYTKGFSKVDDRVSYFLNKLVFDPQSSGGLLISVAEKDVEKLLQHLKNEGNEVASVIGWVQNPNQEYPAGTVIVS